MTVCQAFTESGSIEIRTSYTRSIYLYIELDYEVGGTLMRMRKSGSRVFGLVSGAAGGGAVEHATCKSNQSC